MKARTQAYQLQTGDITSYGRIVSTGVEDDRIVIVAEHGGTRSRTTLPPFTEVTIW